MSTTEAFGKTQSRRNSRSNCEIRYNPDLEHFENTTRDIYCILDVMEHDLFLNKLSLKYNIPEDMCHSVRVTPPWHFNYEVGVGPIVTECERTRTEENDEGEREEVTKTEYCVGSCGNPDRCSEDEEDLCEYNHKIPAAGGESSIVQCCFGVKNAEGDHWGGNLKECIGGPGRTSWDLFDNQYGEPVPRITLAKNGYNAIFNIENIHDVVQGYSGSSIPVANYLKALDVPADEAPLAYERLRERDGPLKMVILEQHKEPFQPYPFFTVECLDDTEEAIHALHLMIREWDTYQEFYDHYQSGGSEGSHPDVTGEEGGDCDYQENRFSARFYGKALCNDYVDMDYYYREGQLFPGLPYQ